MEVRSSLRVIILALLLNTWLFGAKLEWGSEYDEALSLAKIEKKNVYMLITSNDCKWCRKFENTTLQDKKIIKLLNEKYVLLHIDRDMDFLPSKFKKSPVPRHYFLTPKGEIIYTFLGYWDTLDFTSFLVDVENAL